MEYSSKLIIIIIFLISSPPFAWLTLAYHFSEYIGVGYRNINFFDVAINPDVEFHFVVSFALDYTNISSMNVYQIPTNGKFKPYWNTNIITPSTVKSIKASHNNVKVALTLGSDTVKDNIAYFHPYSTDSWIENAVISLTKIINQYSFDGIDFSYGHFKAGEETFAECIGRVVALLKDNSVISFASIAPFDADVVQRYYQALWRKYGHVIDYVNFQFYAYNPGIVNVRQFMDYFEIQRNNYNGGKMLMGLSSDQGFHEGLIGDKRFMLDVCETLLLEEKVSGIFIWCAEASMVNGFQYEKQAQEMIANITSSHH
ncbi:Chitinase protein [Dioscorea alata]|uniref:Chitinase protein n=1 Tax=Dioscorea alata TaxID=55571 RepID=A0ACB7TVN1_DIOAL|nr:Chitinase protein [Dioscorea alata]